MGCKLEQTFAKIDSKRGYRAKIFKTIFCLAIFEDGRRELTRWQLDSSALELVPILTTLGKVPRRLLLPRSLPALESVVETR